MSPQSRLELRLEHSILQVLAVPGMSPGAAKRCLPRLPLASSAVLSVYLASVKVKNVVRTANVLPGPAASLLEASRRVFRLSVFMLFFIFLRG